MPTIAAWKNQQKKNAESSNIFIKPAGRDSFKIDEERKNHFIDWNTFYRRNIHRFIEHYFGIKLFPFQTIWVYYMSKCDKFIAICSRAVGKSWLLSVYACAIAVLYPNSEIVIVSSTKKQAGLIITDKIASLRKNFPNLNREIANLTSNLNDYRVDFVNGSKIKVVAARESTRGDSVLPNIIAILY